MSSPWHIELLGWLRATRGDLVVSRFRSRNHAALLAYLAFYRHRSHPRAQLVELLWPECDVARGRLNLRVALSLLRDQLEPPGVPAGTVILADRSTVQLNPAAVDTDVAAFQSALLAASRAGTPLEQTRRLVEAVSLCRGELLPGCFGDWVLSERQRLAEVYLQALRQLSSLSEEAGDQCGAIRSAWLAVGADPLREESQHDLIRLLIAAGQRKGALQQYQELGRRLHDALGAEPAPGTRALLIGSEIHQPSWQSPRPPIVANHQDERERVANRRAQALVFHRMAEVARRQRDPDRERAFSQESLAVYRQLGDQQQIAAQLRNLGRVVLRQGDAAAAQTLFEESLALRRQISDRHGVAQSIADLGTVARSRKDTVSSRSLFEQSLVLYREVGRPSDIANLLLLLGGVALCQDDLPAARAYYEESLALWQKLGNDLGMTRVLQGLLNVAQQTGEAAYAAPLYEKLLALRPASVDQ
jgi:DNA-binding SARP family transcriptional activator